ncbi:hypothetical protein MATL_G00253360 [Megalops atlanticus]|uniref:Uncharacterized protein n=1 Tax=Megalops atlanticus TaxID=7932 RepID=A0A9D3PC04_MEGAT|nr:hypothetical protein MATL_G00253360 [Megalops atlanticus]
MYLCFHAELRRINTFPPNSAPPLSQTRVLKVDRYSAPCRLKLPLVWAEEASETAITVRRAPANLRTPQHLFGQWYRNTKESPPLTPHSCRRKRSRRKPVPSQNLPEPESCAGGIGLSLFISADMQS